MNNLSNASFYQKKTSEEELSELFTRMKAGDAAARDRIILAYYPLVKKTADRFIDNGVPLDDLIQEGFSGIIHALNNFDPESDTSFGFYAKFYVEKYIRQALRTQSDNTPIIYEEDFFLEIQKYLRVLDDLTKELMRSPTDKELASALRMTETKIRRISQSLFSFQPEDMLVHNEQSLISPEKAVMEHVLDLSFLKIRMTEREREVVSRRLGFTQSGTPESLGEIAEAMGLTHEMIRLTYNGVMKRIQTAVKEKGYTVSTIRI